MSMPAGWYDDGSGRQRWWDGQRWTGQFAPDAVGLVSAVSAPVARVAPVLGVVGLALAVLGTVLACIPATFVVGVVVLIAGFVVSLIGVFKKNAVKWPSIVGMVVSIVGGAIGTVVVLVILASNVADSVEPPIPSDIPSATASEQPVVPPASDSAEGRPSSETIAELLGQNARDGGITGYESMPEFWPCMGQELYNSGISDESLWLIIRGGEPIDEERETSEEGLRAAIRVCDPDGQGAWG